MRHNHQYLQSRNVAKTKHYDGTIAFRCDINIPIQLIFIFDVLNIEKINPYLGNTLLKCNFRSEMGKSKPTKNGMDLQSLNLQRTKQIMNRDWTKELSWENALSCTIIILPKYGDNLKRIGWRWFKNQEYRSIFFWV